MLRIAFDIGGVLSKFPREFRDICRSLSANHFLYIITDMHDKDEILKIIEMNELSLWFPEFRVFSADYNTHGEGAKAVIIKENNIDVFFDDFEAYLSWPDSFGPAPLRLKIMPDIHKPYWHDEWKVPENFEFGRRRYYGSTS